MAKQQYQIAPSEAGIGIPPARTLDVLKNGYYERCTVKSFTPEFAGRNGGILITYLKEILDKNKNTIPEIKPIEKSILIKDKGAIGLVDIDEKGFPILDTFEETTPEDLELTRWYNALAPEVVPGLIYAINENEGYPQQQ